MVGSETKNSKSEKPEAESAPEGIKADPETVWTPPSGETENDPGAAHAESADGVAEETPAEMIARLEAEKSDLTDRLLRVVADMENLRKRSERDLSDTRKYSVSALAADILTVGDNLQRALGAANEVDESAAEEGFKPLLEGVDMTARELDRVLEKHGVKRIDAEGGKFNPHHHQAMFEVPKDDVPSGTIVEVVQAGYMIGDRVLRAALVGIAKDGPKDHPEQISVADSDKEKATAESPDEQGAGGQDEAASEKSTANTTKPESSDAA